MPRTIIETSAVEYGNVISTFDQLEIPTFQRPYSWTTKEEVSTLWNDLFTGDEDFWLLGNLVLCGQGQPEDGLPDLVIDGQQRLTTLVILTAAIRDRLYELYAQGFDPETGRPTAEGVDAMSDARKVQEMFIERFEFGNTEQPEYRLIKSRSSEADWFMSRIQNAPRNPSRPETWGEASEGCAYKPPMAERNDGLWSLSHTTISRSTATVRISEELRRLWQAYNYFQAEIKKVTANCSPEDARLKLKEMLEFLRKGLNIIVTRVPDDETAYVLFETLNNRGMDLSVADLFKNLLFTKASPEDILPKAKESWEHIVAALDHKLIPDYLRHRHMMEAGVKVTKRSLFKELKESVEGVEVLYNYLETLEQQSSLYAEITLAPENIGPSGMDETLREELRIFGLFGYAIVNPILLAAWQVTHALGAETQLVERKKFLRLVESFMFHYTTLGGGFTNKLESEIPQWAKSLIGAGVDGYDDLHNSLSEFLTGQRLEGTVKEHWEGFKNLAPKSSVSKAILYRLNEHVLPEPHELNVTIGLTDDVHLEHIYPQKANDDAEVEFTVINEENREYLTKRLGNTCLLWHQYNREASNGPFSTKKLIYAESDLPLTRDIADVDEWGEESINNQETIYLQKAKEVWCQFD